ncbi:sulfatase [Chenggangzhangella methanolivorans]|uniref:Sulfatase n=1 Tax=Chenggangzhangella methanolivorans TaxID=1437009 RepID=A0A9E6R7P7_9HYPH|nr:sulfatase [Chenggangzhangella methanolivorans]QZN99364.1 sulfatase [Chenggangzhangella methanolivorans]
MARDVSRREILAAGAAVAFGGGALAGPAQAAVGGDLAAPAKGGGGGKRPNVLFVAIDDLNDWTGFLGGYPGVRTPNLDRLAKIATGFTRAYTPAPACKPGRASILFGVEPHKSGVYTNDSGDWWQSDLADKPSIVRFFRDAGYKTIGTGKLFHGGWRHNGDEPRGNDPDAWTEFEPLTELIQSGKEILEWGPEGKTEKTEDVGRAEWLVDNVLSKRHGKPFFAAFGLRKPHMPWVVPQEWFDRYPENKLDYPLGALDVEHTGIRGNKDVRDLSDAGRAMIEQHVKDHRRIIAGKGWKSAIQAYLAAISLADHAVGLVLDGLKKGPNAADTIICVWSDHGWQLGEKLAWRKFTLWERATRVPMLIGGPGLKAGLSDTLISSIDLYPTLAQLAVGEAPKHLDGVSFAKYLRGKGGEPRDHVLSTWSLDLKEGGGANAHRHFAVRDKTYRLIVYGDGSRELYDHRVDPWEWTNLLDKTNRGQADQGAVAELERFVPKRSAPEVGDSKNEED